MSGIAELMANLGYEVTGSDRRESEVTRRLRGLGVEVQIGHAAENLTDADAVVVSTAIDETNPEIVAARAARIPVVRRAEMLAELMRFYYGVALAGAQTGIGIDYTLTNTEAAKWARQWVGTMIKGIEETTLQATREAIAGFIETPGMTIGDVMQALPFDAGRAERIAVTEITRAYGQSEMAVARELARENPGVRVTLEWFTNNDDRVCAICGPLNGKEVNEGEPFFGEGEDAVYAPPAHPACRCFSQARTRIDG
jgi:hypothetical protein